MLPDLMYRRLDELGIDFAVLYPTYGLTVTALPNTELRCALARALNRYYAEVYADYRDRLEPVAAIPTFTPEEAIAELDYAVGELGLKTVMFGGTIPRPYDGAPDSPGRWIDTLGHDSLYDYDPLWRRCEELGVAPTFHSGGQGWGTRMSTVNNSYNQVGNFAAADEGTCPVADLRRRPDAISETALRLPGRRRGVGGRPARRHRGPLGKAQRRGDPGVQPSPAGPRAIAATVRRARNASVAGRLDRLDQGLRMLSDPDELPGDIDMFGESLLTGVDDLFDIFANRFFFGCEADDPMNVLAFASHLNPGGMTLPAIFASDIGHWDVRDMREVVPEAYELVEHGHIDEEQFRAFVFDNPVRLWAGMNPDFFRGHGRRVRGGEGARLTSRRATDAQRVQVEHVRGHVFVLSARLGQSRHRIGRAATSLPPHHQVFELPRGSRAEKHGNLLRVSLRHQQSEREQPLSNCEQANGSH